MTRVIKPESGEEPKALRLDEGSKDYLDISDALGGFAPAADASPGCDDDVLPVCVHAQIPSCFDIRRKNLITPTFVPIVMRPRPQRGQGWREGGCPSDDTGSSFDYLPRGLPTRLGRSPSGSKTTRMRITYQSSSSPKERQIPVKKRTPGCTFTHISPTSCEAPS